MSTSLPTQTVPSGSPVQDNVLVTAGELDPGCAYTELRMADGQVVRLPTQLLLSGAVQSGEYMDDPVGTESGQGDGSLVVPVVEEQLTVGKRTVATGTVRLRKTVQEYQQALDEPLAVRTFDVERVVLNRPIETVPEVRQEGETTIYPLIEERLILTKELVLKEELRVTRRDSERRDTQVVTLRREHVVVERSSTDADESIGATRI